MMHGTNMKRHMGQPGHRSALSDTLAAWPGVVRKFERSAF